MPKWNMNLPWAKDNYLVRIAEAKFGASKRTDNPMITLDLEVVSPEMMGDLTVAGTPLKHYLVTAVIGDEEKTKECQSRTKETLEAMGLDCTNLNWDNPDLSSLANVNIWTILSAKPSEKRKDPTPEQKSRGELGDVLVDPITGVKQVTYYPSVEKIYGVPKA